MKWPRGKNNGQRITGVCIRFRFNLLWWYWYFHPCWFGTFTLHAGPVHLWIELDYELL